MAVEVVVTGTWVYDGTVASPVWIVSADFDFWYEVPQRTTRLSFGKRQT